MLQEIRVFFGISEVSCGLSRTLPRGTLKIVYRPSMSRDNIKSYVWSLAISIPLAVALLCYALRDVDWHRIGALLAGARPSWLCFSAAVLSISYFLRALRWRILLNAAENIRIPTVFWASTVGYLANNFLPARAGEVVRSVMISGRSKLSKTYVLTTALAERLMDVIVLVLLSGLMLLNLNEAPPWLRKTSLTMTAVGVFGGVCIIVLPRVQGTFHLTLLRLPLPKALRGKLIVMMEQVLLGLRSFHHYGRSAYFCSLTLTVWVLDALVAIMVARALGLSLSFPVALLLLTGLGLASALPSTPGYVGIFQFVAVTILVPFGIGHNDALAYILAFQALGYVVLVVWGLMSLWQYRAVSN